jgi:DNA polymerase-3 subunit gamma/tau
VQVEPDGIALIARAAEGSARDGLSLLDQALVQKPGATVAAADIRDMLGLADRGRVLDLFEAVARGDARTAIAEARSQYDSGADPTLILRDLLDVGHEAARAQAMGTEARLIGGADWVTRVRALAERLSPAQLSRLWQMLLKAFEEAGKAPDPIAAVEMAVVRLCAAQTLPPPEEAARLLRDGGPSWSASASASANAAPSCNRTVNSALVRPAAQTTPPAPDPPFKSFEDVTAAVAEERDIELELALERLKIVRFSPMGEIVFVANESQPRDLVRRLKAFLEERTPFEWTVRATSEAAAPVESIAERRRREDERKMDEVKRQPFVAEALKAFPGAEIASVRQPADETAPAGDVVPMPKPQETAAPARKKEADR